MPHEEHEPVRESTAYTNPRPLQQVIIPVVEQNTSLIGITSLNKTEMSYIEKLAKVCGPISFSEISVKCRCNECKDKRAENLETLIEKI